MFRTMLLIFLCCSAAMAQETESQARPGLSFSTVSHDFGNIEKGDKVSVNFEFKNSGDAELVITDVKASCGCTTASPDKQNYAPGERGVIPVTFDSTRFAGPITKTVTVTSNDPAMPQMQLRITGNVRSEILADPVSLAISNIRRTDSVAREFVLTTESMDRLEVSELQPSLDFMKLTEERVDDKTIKINVNFNGADLPRDRDVFQGQISYKTNGTRVTQGAMSVFIRVLKPVHARPGSVYFFSTPQGSEREMIVTISTEEGKELKMGKIESSAAYLSAEVVEGNQMKITLSKDAAVGKFDGTITVETNIAEQPVLVIPVRGSVI